VRYPAYYYNVIHVRDALFRSVFFSESRSRSLRKMNDDNIIRRGGVKSLFLFSIRRFLPVRKQTTKKNPHTHKLNLTRRVFYARTIIRPNVIVHKNKRVYSGASRVYSVDSVPRWDIWQTRCPRTLVTIRNFRFWFLPNVTVTCLRYDKRAFLIAIWIQTEIKYCSGSSRHAARPRGELYL